MVSAFHRALTFKSHNNVIRLLCVRTMQYVLDKAIRYIKYTVFKEKYVYIATNCMQTDELHKLLLYKKIL